MFTLPEIIDLAVRIEKNGAKVYGKAEASASNASLASLLGWLKEEEAEHEKWFKAFREELGESEEDPRLEEMGQAVLQGVLGDQAFSIAEADFNQIKEMRSLLELSLEFEKDTILFYQMLSAFLEDAEILNRLNQIIEEENRHVQRLEDFLEKEKRQEETL
jgi:rubrerythrin